MGMDLALPFWQLFSGRLFCDSSRSFFCVSTVYFCLVVTLRLPQNPIFITVYFKVSNNVTSNTYKTPMFLQSPLHTFYVSCVKTYIFIHTFVCPVTNYYSISRIFLEMEDEAEFPIL